MDEIEAKRGARAKAITKRWRGIALAFVAGCALLAAVLLWPMNTARYLAVDASGEIVDRRGETLMAFLNREEQWCFPRPLKEISPYLVKATIAAEDQRFREHPGVDPIAVIRAASQNLRSQGVVSGASTLTMQVVKNGPASSRSWVGKALQTIDAIRLDARVSKDRILETYLNSAPYGLNLVGCEAAARRYFGVPARELDIAEAALLAGLPKSPTGFMPLAHPEEARQRRDYVLGRMLEEGYIDQKDFDRAIDTPLDVSWHEYPMLSPHLAMRLEPRAHTQGRVITTLDLTIQAKVESIVAEHMARWSGEITNAAVLVVDVDTASVLARIGSGGFFHTPGGGQVDACRALRSPGSTLKPFIYGYAMENDLVYPCETLYDG
ncbi:MAG: transglycosylase domain-containing protein, partial [Candidatus Hydrogenedentes bacterium]|nr:transglycosylase domain-containing protein [Candidatus Hydrogenedentota bacterium]